MSLLNERTVLVVLCLLLFFLSFSLYTQNNDFPFYAHHDEEAKIEQLLSRDFNFNHPQLMLVGVDLVRRAKGQHENFQELVLTGRQVSAFYASLAVVIFTVLGWRALGLPGAVCMGAMVAACPVVGITAHFLKEDTSLLLGMAALLLACQAWWDRQGVLQAAGLGLALGLVLSAKYIGAISLLAVLPLLVLHGRNKPGSPGVLKRLVLVLLPAAAVFAVINWPVFFSVDQFSAGFEKGANLAASGRKQVALPNLNIFAALLKLSPVVFCVTAVGIWMTVWGALRPVFAAWALMVTGAVFTFMMVLTPLHVPDRYLLMPGVSAYALAGLAIAAWVRGLADHSRHSTLFRGGLTLGVLGALIWVSSANYRQLALDAFVEADARADLIHWINENLDESDRIASLKSSRLPGVDGRGPAHPSLAFSQPVITLYERKPGNTEWLNELKSRGVTHLILRERYLAQMPPAGGGLDGKSYKVLWMVPDRFEDKNRWLRSSPILVEIL